MIDPEIIKEFEAIVPGLVTGMSLNDAMTLILAELKRLREGIQK